MGKYRLNWDVLIRCKDCGARYIVEKPDVSTDPVERKEGPPLRIVLAWVPNACPNCTNIRPAGSEDA